MLNYKSPLTCTCFLIVLFNSAQAAPQTPFITIDAHPDGELILLPSPDSLVVNDLPIMAFKGLPAFGRHQLKLTSKVYSKQQLNFLNQNATRIHSELMRMKLATNPPNTARLKNNYKGGGSQGLQYNSGHGGDVIEDRAWYRLIANLAAASMTEQSYTQYMCKDDPCSRMDLKGKNNGSISAWGGLGANQFESRRAFNSFIDTELDKYMTWAEQLNAEPEIYFVGQTRLSPYIFDKGGFAVRINRVSGGGLPTTGENLKNHPVFTATVDNTIPGILVKVREAEAEKIVERVYKKQLFYVYKAKLTVAEQSFNVQTKQLDFNRLLFDQTITSDVIEVFIGPELQDKLFDIPL